MKLKRIAACLLGAIMLISLPGCSGSPSGKNASDADASVSGSASADDIEKTEKNEETVLEEPENFGMVTEKNPIVQTAYGPVMGKTEDGVANFRAIPYGGNVDGEQRFLRAENPQPWTEPLDCTYLRARAVQSVGRSGHGNLFQEYVGDYFAGGRIGELTLNDQYDDENCLNLNVVTPGLDSKKRPVVVYVHGGGYTQGSNAITAGAYNLSREEDVVIVGVNHRLSFGYLYLGAFDEKYADSGMVSMLDVVKALEWVRDNIENFGGDPGNVTIMGESGGGGKMQALLLMEEARGLFHKAVIMSAVGSDGWRTPEEASDDAKAVLDILGVGTDELYRLADFTTEELWTAMQESGAEFSPVIDGKNLKGNLYESDENARKLLAETAAGVPVMVTTARDEMKWLSGNGNRDLFDITWETLPDMLKESYGGNTQKIIETYKGVYPDYSASDIYFRISTDTVFGNKAARLADLLSESTGAPVYRYIYCHECQIEGGIFGAYHTADLPLFFRMVMYEEDEMVSRQLAASIAEFMRIGDPSTEKNPWPEYTSEKRQIVFVDDQYETAENPEKMILELWESLGVVI